MSANGRGTWYVRPMPSLHRAAASSLVTVRPAKRTWPAPGERSPEMRPNRLVLPAPFGPTIPATSPGPTANDRSSAMTTRPNRFVTLSSSRSALVIRSGVGRQEVGGDLRLRLQGVGHAGRGAAGGEVQWPGHRLGEVDLVDGGGDLGLVVRVARLGEGRVGRFEEAVVADVGVPLPVGGRLEIVGQL